MQIVKFVNKSYKMKTDMMNLLCYIAERASFVSGYGINTYEIENVYCAFEYVKRYWCKDEEGKRQVRHLIVIFDDCELSLDVVNEIAWKIAGLYGQRFQIFYGIHMDGRYPHIHFAINTVSYIDGLMFSEGYGDLIRLKSNIEEICTNMKI